MSLFGRILHFQYGAFKEKQFVLCSWFWVRLYRSRPFCGDSGSLSPVFSRLSQSQDSTESFSSLFLRFPPSCFHVCVLITNYMSVMWTRAIKTSLSSAYAIVLGWVSLLLRMLLAQEHSSASSWADCVVRGVRSGI